MKFSRLLAPTLLLGALSAFAPLTYAKTCQLEIGSNDAMQFDKKTLQVAADCTEVELTLKHNGKLPVAAMGHNWVLSETAVFKEVATAGISAGAAKQYVPEGDARVLAHTKVVGGGESTSIKFSTAALKAGGDYTFFCSFPGHWAMMQGKFVFGG